MSHSFKEGHGLASIRQGNSFIGIQCWLDFKGGWEGLTFPRIWEETILSAPKSQRFLRFAIAMPIADPRNRAISETRQSNAALRLRVRWKVASDLQFRAAISEPKTSSFCRISCDLAPSNSEIGSDCDGAILVR